MAIYRNNLLNEFLKITRALSDENRIKALFSLKNGELCLCQVVELLGLAQSTVSKHVSILKDAGLVESRKEQRWIYFRLPEGKISPVVRGALAWLFSSTEKDKSLAGIRKAVDKILKIDRDEICQKVNRKAGITRA